MHKPEVKYQTLKAGDVRQKGDEQRGQVCYKARRNGEAPIDSGRYFPQDWRLISLISHPILTSDLIHLEFRRPI